MYCPLPANDYSNYFFQSLAKAFAASLSARSFCKRALSVRLRRGLTRSRKATAAVRERLSSLSTTVRAASKIIRGSKLSGFDDVLMRRLQAGERFPTIQAMWESDVGQILIAFLESSTIFRGYRSGEDLGDG